MKTFKSIDTLVNVEDHYYSDWHKDVYGFRPRGYDLWVTKDHWTRIEATLIRDGEIADQEEKERTASAIKAFDALVLKVMRLVNTNRYHAIEILKADDESYEYDPEYFDYCHGIPYGYLEFGIAGKYGNHLPLVN